MHLSNDRSKSFEFVFQTHILYYFYLNYIKIDYNIIQSYLCTVFK